MNDRQEYELNQIIQVDTTSISSDDEKTNEDYFIINTMVRRLGRLRTIKATSAHV